MPRIRSFVLGAGDVDLADDPLQVRVRRVGPVGGETGAVERRRGANHVGVHRGGADPLLLLPEPA